MMSSESETYYSIHESYANKHVNGFSNFVASYLLCLSLSQFLNCWRLEHFNAEFFKVQIKLNLSGNNHIMRKANNETIMIECLFIPPKQEIIFPTDRASPKAINTALNEKQANFGYSIYKSPHPKVTFKENRINGVLPIIYRALHQKSIICYRQWLPTYTFTDSP